MKTLALLIPILLVGCGQSTPAGHSKDRPVVQQVKSESIPEGCTVVTKSKLVTEHRVGEITNLVKDIDPNGRCTVKFDITVNDTLYHLEETETGYEQIASLCYYARERARKNLLLDLGGEFANESVTSCKSTIGKNSI